MNQFIKAPPLLSLIKVIGVLLIIIFLTGCAVACNTPMNLRISLDFLKMAREFLDVSVILFNCDHQSQGLARLYYMFFSLQRINYYRRKRTNKVSGEKKHQQLWSGSLASKKLEKSFGKVGFLGIRHRCDYGFYNEDVFKKDIEFWINSTDSGYTHLIEETKKSVDILTSCNIPNCDCQRKHSKEIEDCKLELDKLNNDYLDFHNKYKSD